jgi:hypothetical protein
VGGFVRAVEVLFFGAPLVHLLRAGRHGGFEHLMHLKGVKQHLPLENLNPPEVSFDVNTLNKKYLPSLFGVKLHIHTGIVMFNSGHYYTNRIEDHDFLSGYNYNALFSLRRKRNSEILGRYTHLPLQKYYYHFLLEDLPPLLAILKTNPQIAIITPPAQPRYVTETLNRLGVPIVTLDEKVVLVDELILPLKTLGTKFEDYQGVVDLFSTPAIEQTSIANLLLLRGNRPRGNEEFEKLLIEILSPEGYRVIDPEKFTIEEQARLFSSASRIVSLHGGALTNLIFAPAKAKVFEIHSHTWRNYAFPVLARLCNLDYTGADVQDFEAKLKRWILAD